MPHIPETGESSHSSPNDALPHHRRRRRWRHSHSSRRKRVVNLVLKALVYIVGIVAIIYTWTQLVKP